MDLFEYQADKTTAATRPLADRMRPKDLTEFIGQQPVVGDGSLIRQSVENDRIFSMILWGPPGSGKTTLARIVAAKTRSHFVSFSAVLSGVKEIRAVIETAKDQLKLHGRRTLLFVDEIHRFNKSQQDAFLHHVESGLITLIGATTENPSFEVIPALLSRCRVITLNPLTGEEMALLLDRALTDRERGLGRLGLQLAPDALHHLAAISDGDARSALNALEIAATIIAEQPSGEDTASRVLTLADVETALQRKALQYDKAGDEHFNLISAFHKSLRGSNPDAALYWFARMMMAGEDPLYIARRMVRFASEDVGNADPRALTLTMDAMAAYRFLGSPEGDLCLAQAVVYLATAPKSNRVYAAFGKINDIIRKTGNLPVPLHIRNAPTGLMKDLGYGKDYRYAHDYEDGYVSQEYLPEKLRGSRFYEPTDRGYEKMIADRLAYWRRKVEPDHEGSGS